MSKKYFLKCDFTDMCTNKLKPDQEQSSSVEQHKLTKIERVVPRTLNCGRLVNATARKDCRLCYKKKVRNTTNMECKACPGEPPLCFDCFFKLHTFCQR